MSQENSNFNTSAKPDVSRPILIFRLGSLGDTILAMPCFHLIRRVYPDRKIFLLASEPISGKAAAAMTVLDGSGLCDEVIAYPTKVRNFRRLFALRQQIKSHRFEMVFHLFTNRGWLRNWRDYLFFRACGIKCIIGTPPPFRRNSITTSHPLVEQQCIGLVRRLRQIGDIDVSDKAAWNLRLNAEEKETAEILLQGSKVSHPFIAASIGTKSPINDWGDDNWKQLFELLSTAHPELGLILIGSPDEFKRSEHIRRYWRGTSANFCGKCLPRVSAGILAFTCIRPATAPGAAPA